MAYKYNILTGVSKVKTKLAIAVSALGVGAAGVFGAAAILGTAHADSTGNINFEPTSYTAGPINGQHNWSALGSVGLGCANYDEGVTTNNSLAPASFGAQSFRISNAVTSGCFGDQAYAPKLSQWAGEPDALDNNGNPVSSPQSHFEAQFDIASATKANQGMSLSVSPDDGVGARMSYLSFVDQSDGIHVNFYDVKDSTHGIGQDSFNLTPDVAVLSYGSPHTIKFSMNFYSGPDNDVVNIYIDGTLVHTGTSWEDYYRFDTESNPGLTNNDSRAVNTLEFREGGNAVSANMGNGYLIDNLSMKSGAIPPNLPTSKDQCMNGGWMDYLVFKNQGDCVSFVASKGKNKPSLTLPQPPVHSVLGTVTLDNPTQNMTMNLYDNGVSANDTGFVTYENPGVSLKYTVPPTCVNVVGNTAYFAYQIPSNAPVAADVWVVWKVVDGSPDTAGFSTASDMSNANSMCESGFTPTTYSTSNVTGDIMVQ